MMLYIEVKKEKQKMFLKLLCIKDNYIKQRF